MVDALNELGGYSLHDVVQHAGMANPKTHIAGRQHVKECVKFWGKPPPELSRRGAFRELQASHGYDGAPVTVVAMDLDLLSLRGAGEPRGLDGLLRGGRAEIRRFCEDFCLPKDQAGRALREDSVLRSPYCNPLLRQPRRYEELIRMMDKRGMLEYAVEVTEQCGLFAVKRRTIDSVCS